MIMSIHVYVYSFEKRSLLSGDHNHDLCSVPDLPHPGGQTHLQVIVTPPPPIPRKITKIIAKTFCQGYQKQLQLQI